MRDREEEKATPKGQERAGQRKKEEGKDSEEERCKSDIQTQYLQSTTKKSVKNTGLLRLLSVTVTDRSRLGREGRGVRVSVSLYLPVPPKTFFSESNFQLCQHL